MKEPGPFLFEVISDGDPFGREWHALSVKGKAIYARGESAIRADQSDKVWEEAAKVLDERASMYRAKAEKHDSAAADTVTEHERLVSNAEASEHAAAAIRAKIGAGHG